MELEEGDVSTDGDAIRNEVVLIREVTETLRENDRIAKHINSILQIIFLQS